MPPEADRPWLDAAARLALRGRPLARPNPAVGALIVSPGGRVVGRGWTMAGGRPHAEAVALETAGGAAAGATLYVSLEPCAHQSQRGPACADLVAASGLARVVVGCGDPDPRTAGSGIARIRGTGIAVEQIDSAACAASLEGYLTRAHRGRPHVTLKLALSLDGCIAMASGESQWITGPAARAAVQRLRARSSVVLTGADTVLADDARLTVRADELGLGAELSALAQTRPPLRVLVDGRLRVSLNVPFFQAGAALVATCAAASARDRYLDDGHELLAVPGSNGHVDLRKLLVELAARGANEVLVEAGPRLAGAFARLGLVDEYQLFVAAKFLGSSARPLLDWPLAKMAEAQELQIVEMRAVGDDWRIIARPVPRGT